MDFNPRVLLYSLYIGKELCHIFLYFGIYQGIYNCSISINLIWCWWRMRVCGVVAYLPLESSFTWFTIPGFTTFTRFTKVYQVYQFTSWSKSENFLANFADMGSFENRKWSKNMLGLHKTIEISTNIITDRRKKVNSTLEKSVQQVSNVLFIFSGISWIKSYGWFCHSSIWIKIGVDIGASGISWSPKFEWRWTNTLLL